MWFGILHFLARRCTGCLVRPLFVVKIMWFGIPNFCDAEGEWVKHGVEDQLKENSPNFFVLNWKPGVRFC